MTKAKTASKLALISSLLLPCVSLQALEFNEDFNDLASSLNGQGGWTAPEQAVITSPGLDYSITGGATLLGGDSALLLNGDENASMNSWAVKNLGTVPDGDIYYRFLFYTDDAGAVGDDTIDPTEIFMRIPGWSNYIAIKVSEGILELAGGTVTGTINIPAAQTHMLVGKMSVTDGNITQVDVWLNPGVADQGTPILTADYSANPIAASTVSQIQLRSQKAPTLIDNLAFSSRWSDVVPGTLAADNSIFRAEFDDQAGPLDGQDGWVAPDQAIVEAPGLVYDVANGGTIQGMEHALLLNGDEDASMNSWAIKDFDSPLSTTTYFRMLFYTDDAGAVGDNTIDPTEIFLRIPGWSVYAAVKVSEGILELPGGNQSGTLNIPVGQTNLLVGKLTIDETGLIGAELWLNPAQGDEGTPVLVADYSGSPIDPTGLTGVQLRSQKAPTYVDSLVFAPAWNDVVPAPNNSGVYFDQTFEGYFESLDGQNGWTAPAGAQVVSGGLRYMIEEGGVVEGGAKALQFNGSASSPVNNWAVKDFAAPLGETSWFRMLFYTDDPGTTEDPNEIFMRLPGWGVYVAVKITQGIIEVPGANVDSLVIPLAEVHMLLGRLVVDGDDVVGIELWLNPADPDNLGDPLLTASYDAGAKPAADVTGIQLRCQKAVSLVDEVLFSTDMADLFSTADFDFNDLAVGALDGQDGWTAPEQAVVEAGGLSYGIMDGGKIDGTPGALFLNGDEDASMNDWAIKNMGSTPTETFYFRFLFNTDDAGAVGDDTIDPTELFVRMPGWGVYAAVKLSEGVLELPGGIKNDPVVIPVGETNLVMGKVTVEGGDVVGMDLWLNPAYGDEGAPLVSATYDAGAKPVSDINGVQIRSQKAPMLFDELVFGDSWESLLPSGMFDFDNLVPGPLDGQDAWIAPEQASVISDDMMFDVAGGGVIDGSPNALLLNGDENNSMNDWAIKDFASAPESTVYFRFLFETDDAGAVGDNTIDPTEIFVRMPGWGVYAAVKVSEGVLEVPGATSPTLIIPVAETNMLVGRLTISSGDVVGMTLWLNPSFNGIGQPSVTAQYDPGAKPASGVTGIQVRSQKAPSLFDEFVLGASWEDVVPAAEGFELVISADPTTVSVEPALSAYPQGTQVTITANPPAGLAFAGWSGDLAGQGNPAQVTVSGNLTFAPIYVTAADAERLVNISTRGYAGSGADSMIAGFVIDGQEDKSVLVRALGPALANLGVSGALTDPRITVFDSNGQVVDTNSRWVNATSSSEIGDLVGSSFGSEDEPALLLNLTPGAYTAIVDPENGANPGLAIVEVYEVGENTVEKLVNIATRLNVGTADAIGIGGFVIGGQEASPFLMRGMGPSLAGAGLTGVLANPVLTLYDANGNVVATSDNWRSSTNASLIENAMNTMGLATPDNAEGVILQELAPGAYTVWLTGASDSTGIGLVEIYEAP